MEKAPGGIFCGRARETRIAVKLAWILGILGCLSLRGLCQDAQRIQPKPAALTAPPAAVEDTRTAMREDISHYDSTPFGVDLKGIALFEGKAPEPTERLKCDGVQVMRGKLEKSDLLEKKLNAFLGKPISVRLVEEVRRAILDFYEKRRYFVSVPIANQEATTGIFQFGVTFRRWRKISIEGSPRYDAELYKRPFASLIDFPVTDGSLIEGLNALRRNPFRKVDYTPSDLGNPNDEGGLGLRLAIEEKFPLSLSVGVDNQGVPILGEERYSLSLATTDPFHLDHVIQYRFITADDPRKETAHYLTYLLPSPFDYKHTIQLIGIYSQSKAKTLASGEEITNTGKSSQLTLSYAIPLQRFLNVGNQEISAGIDYKSSDSNFEFGGTAFSKTGTETYQSWISHSISIDYSKERWIQSAGLTNRIIFSPGGIGSKNSDEAYQTIRAGGSANYLYWRADLSATISAPESLARSIQNAILQKFASDTLLSLAMTAQASTENLLPAEQLSFGGADSVRGFEENAQLVDDGLLLRAELYSPPCSGPVAVAQRLFAPERPIQDQARLFAFFDYGLGRNNTRVQGEPNSYGLGSAGIGLLYSVGDRLTAKVSYGWQLIETNFVDQQSGRWHFSVSVSY